MEEQRVDEKVEEKLPNENYFRLIAGMVTDIMFYYDIKKDRMMNCRCRNGVFGKEYYIDNPTDKLLRFVYPADKEIFLKFMKELKEGKEEVSIEFRAQKVDGSFSWIAFEGKTISSQGMPEAVIGRAQLIDKRSLQEERAYTPEEQDMLTKVMKRSYINELLELYFQSKPKERAAVIVLDLDDFATINATMGHMFGDEVLISVAGAIIKQLAVGDQLGRIGGDKFLICVKNIENREVVRHKAEEIQQALSALYLGEGQMKPLTASLGIAVYPEHGTDYAKLYDQAADALYFAKMNGKNRYCFGEEADVPESQGHEALQVKEADAVSVEEELQGIEPIGYELMEIAFRLMEEDVDVESIINMMLHKMADHYDLSAVCIREITDRPNVIKVSYEYLSRDYTRADIGKDQEMTDEQWDMFVHKYRDGYYLYERQENAENDNVAKYKTTDELQTLLQIPLYKNRQFQGVIDCCDAYRKRKWTNSEIATLKMFGRIVSGYLLNMRDYRSTTAMVEQLREKDGATGLYRYDTFLHKLQEKIEAEPETDIVLIHSDIRHFKNTNEKYEYEISSFLLKSFAEGMMNAQEKYTFLFGTRMHSDNIIVAVSWPKEEPEDELVQLIRKHNHTFISSVQMRLVQSSITVNTGLYFLKKDDMAKTAVANVNLARKSAKERADGIPVVFSEKMVERVNRQMQMIASLPEAIANKELVVYFQPKVECTTDKLVGAEALVRWKKKNGGFYFPDEFIPLFEKNGSVVDVDYYVYRETFAWLRKRLDEGKPVVPVSMNVSRIHLMDDALLHYIDELLQEYKLPPELLEFELTENIYIDNMENALKYLTQLRKRGIKVSMDDFGSGYSSLNMLNNLPIDVLKLDRVFLAKGELSPEDKIIVSCIVEMAKKLQITALCEGVETREQSEFLSDIGCDVMQGYYYGKPMPVEDFESYMNKE